MKHSIDMMRVSDEISKKVSFILTNAMKAQADRPKEDVQYLTFELARGFLLTSIAFMLDNPDDAVKQLRQECKDALTKFYESSREGRDDHEK